VRKPKPDFPTTKTPVWAPASGCDVNIVITAKDATMYKREQKRGQ
jgi:hypothetical protein